MPSISDSLKAQLITDEGLRLLPYKDTQGHLTIGVGHNLSRGISEHAAMFILGEDIDEHLWELSRALPWVKDLPLHVHVALGNMAFNMGVPALLKFENMLSYLKAGNYTEAANEALKSRWAIQVGDRAKRVAAAIRAGV